MNLRTRYKVYTEKKNKCISIHHQHTRNKVKIKTIPLIIPSKTQKNYRKYQVSIDEDAEKLELMHIADGNEK